MCGFTGFALDDLGARADRALLQRMTDTLLHRGPDDEGLFTQGPVALGFRRLSIIDLAGGHQPIESPEGDLVVVGNGEIYNYQELRKGLQDRGAVFQTGSDIETILHLYREKGAALAADLVGMFAFCVYDLRDPRRPKVVLGRDRLGIKPLYWGRNAKGLFFGSETKALLASETFPREMRRESLLDYLVQGYCGGEHSVWSGIERLTPGTTLEWSPGETPRITRYWDLPTDELRGPAQDEEVLEWVDRVVQDRLMAEVPLGAFLSGGIDSNAVVESMQRARDEAPVLCSVGFAEASHDELSLAKATANKLGAIHHTEVLSPDPSLALDVLPWFYDEPLADPSTVPTYLVSQMARRHVTVALSGDGGDETFAGYRRYVHDMAENRMRGMVGTPGRKMAAAVGAVYPKLDWAPRVLRARTFLRNLGTDPARAYWESVSQITRVEALRLLNPDVVHALGEYDSLDAFRDHYDRPGIDCPLYRAQYGDFHTNLPNRILAKVDRASMAVSLEARVPLLDHRFVERFAHLPASEKIRGARGKHRLREALRGRVSGDVLDGKKRGFDTPLKSWIAGPLSSITANAIESLPEDWFQKAALRQRLVDHKAGRRDSGWLLWSLLVLEQWRRRHGVTGLAA